MRFHILSLPHTETTPDYCWCAYSTKLRHFCDMMSSLGHEVVLYAGPRNTAKVSEHIVCSLPCETPPTWDIGTLDPQFVSMNTRIIEAMKPRIQPRDFICHVMANSHPVAAAFPDNMSVEIGIGYHSTFSQYRVFESYAWMHTIYGAQGPEPVRADRDGEMMKDTVIPNAYDVDEFPFSEERGDYYLYIGRMLDRKGVRIAAETCKRLGAKLILAGEGPDIPDYGEYVGRVGVQQRGELMSKALAVFAPTQYIEPFGGVAVEAQLCGVPAITTDFGAFTETVGSEWRCRTLREFMDAAQSAEDMPSGDRLDLRATATDRFSTTMVKYQYEAYFERIETLWGDGWYAL